MFAIECPRHRSRVLVPASRIRGLHNDPRGILLMLECWCGTLVTLRTGRRPAATTPPQARVAVSLSR